MKRTQIILQERQYQELREIAGRKKQSVSSIIREMIDDKLNQFRISSKDPLFDIVGMVEGKGEAISENVDKRLYRRRKW